MTNDATVALQVIFGPGRRSEAAHARVFGAEAVGTQHNSASAFSPSWTTSLDGN